jgi:transcriptional regulator with XRE-family HTH domain
MEMTMMTKRKTKVQQRVTADEVDIGVRLRVARLERKMTQQALGDALGVTFQQIQKYEKGLNRVASSRLSEIARVLKKPVSYFLDTAPASADRGLVERMLSMTGGVDLARAFVQLDAKERRQAVEKIEEIGA